MWKDNCISAMKELHNVEVGKIKKKLADVGAKILNDRKACNKVRKLI